MSKMQPTTFVLLACLLNLSHFGLAAQTWRTPHATQDLTSIDQQWQITGDDPFFVYDLSHPASNATQAGWVVEVQCHQPVDTSWNLDLFWQEGANGFSETHKISFQIPPSTSGQNFLIHWDQLRQAIPNSEKFPVAIRVDPNLPVGSVIEWKLRDMEAGIQSPLPCLPPAYLNDAKQARTGIPTAAMNAMGTWLGQLKVTGGDPHLVFDFSDNPLLPGETLRLKLDSAPTPRRYMMIEYYWASHSQGFSEACKGWIVHRIDDWKTQACAIDLWDLVHTLQPEISSLTGLRLDFAYPWEAAFSLNIERIPEAEIAPSSKILSLRYNIDPHRLNQPALTRRAWQLSLADFWKRLGADPGFLIPYILMISGLSLWVLTIIGITIKTQLRKSATR
jgi:hypothetical protein